MGDTESDFRRMAQRKYENYTKAFCGAIGQIAVGRID